MMDGMVRRLVPQLKMPLLALLITICFYWKLTLSGQYSWMDQPDNTGQVMTMVQEETVQWRHGHFPLWDAHMWGGEPIPGQVQPAVLNPLFWVLFSIPLNGKHEISLSTLNWFYAMVHWLALLLAYWLARDVGLSRLAALFCGCAYAFGGFVGNVGWLQHETSGILLPAVLLYLLRLMRGQRPLASAALGGVFLGASFLMGHHNVPLFATVAVLGFWVYYYVAVDRPRNWRGWLPAAAFFLCFGLIAATQILPSYEFGTHSVRWVGAKEPMRWKDKVPYTVYDQFALPPAGILGFVVPGFQRSVPASFTGLVVVALAVLGFLTFWGKREIRMLAILAVVSALYALGPVSLLHGLVYTFLPDLDKARSACDAVALADLALVLLAAFAFDGCRQRVIDAAHHRGATRVLLGAAGLMFSVVALLLTLHKDVDYSPFALTAIVAALLAGLLAACWSSRITGRAAGILLIALLLFELDTVVNGAYRPYTADAFLSKLYIHDDVAKYLRSRPKQVRVELDDAQIFYNFGDWYGIDELGGVQAGLLKNVYEMQGEYRARMILGVNYYVGVKPMRADQVEISQQSGLRIYSNPSAFDRARLVYSALGTRNEKAAADLTLSDKTAPERQAVVEGTAPELGNCSGGSAQISQYEPARVVMTADAPCRGMLILGDVWFPGWDATVDGKSAKIYKVYNLVRGVVVEPGKHEVVMTYRPMSVFAGMALGLLGLLACFLICRLPETKF
jgi:hypothetical protein